MEETSASEQAKPNRLIHEKSPYLLQHAYNPVDWYPWGEEAFEKARKENKPIFLSIGYSTCHWCHVMEHESFEDPEVAKLMNDTFVSIKVDREERPDIDNIYMAVCQMTTGSGGWPLTIVMTPDKKPFFAGTYIPKHDRFGRVGMLELVPRLKEIWQQRHEDVLHSAEQITAALQQGAHEAGGGDVTEAVLKSAYGQLHQRFDETYGGFGSAPKFPTPHQLTFLLRYWKRTRDAKALQMVEETLQEMRKGGIYDQIGFGFHRYSTDRYWLVPHFEKMLYDQALLAMAYTESYQATHKAEYKKTAEEIFEYVLRDMTDASGGFYSAEDADSEGVEGKFYLWSAGELRRVLGKDDADFAMQIFNVKENGNFVDQVSGHQATENILHLNRPLADLKADHARIEAIRQKLFTYREKRVHPHKDDKILTDWNGLMIAALAKASRVFQEPKFEKAAARSADFLLTHLRRSDGGLLHRYRDGQAAITANLDDYAFLIHGLSELYESSFETRHLETALQLNQFLLKHFWDGRSGAFYFTSDNAENLLVRSKEIYDGAVPSGNSVAMLNLIRLGRLTANPDLEQKAAAISRAFSSSVKQGASAYTQLLMAVDFALGPSYEVVIAGDPQSADTRALLSALHSEFFPNKVVLLRPTNQESPAITNLAAFTRYQSTIHGKAAAYVCSNYVCKAPTTDSAKMLQLLKGAR